MSVLNNILLKQQMLDSVVDHTKPRCLALLAWEQLL